MNTGNKKLTLMVALLATTMITEAEEIAWYDGKTPVSYHVESHVAPVVGIALDMFADDMRMVTGSPATSSPTATIRISQLDRISRSGSDKLRRQGVPVDQLAGRHDAFYIGTHDGHIVIVGSNGRGCAYGILEMSRRAGVSPWVWWGDVTPARREHLTLPHPFSTLQQPSVSYRGIFINDEDWSLRHWSSTTFEPTGRTGIGPKTYREIFKLLLRLRANTIWPAMHEGGTGFFTVKGNKEVADSCDIVIGTSHCEPLLRNNVAEWDKQQRGPYNYITNGAEVRRFWSERLKQVRGSEELFTIGMRGIHDGSMEGVKTPEEKLNGLQRVIDDQRHLIAKYYNKRVEQVPQVFIPYKEVLEIMESGLRVPDDVTLMWCDDNYGYMTRLSDEAQQRRTGGGGVYYHLSYWGRPHDHLWLTTTQPGLIYNEMRTAYDHNCRRLWIANVHDPKVAAYDLELFLDMAWDIDAVTPTSLYSHMERWLATQFGPQIACGIAPAMKEFYRLNAIRKPEFMGWTQTELDKKKFPRGNSKPSATEFTLAEACQRLADFGRIETTVDAYARMVPERLHDAYYAHVVYPVHAAAAMSRKMLSADDAACQAAYDEIQTLTARYNALGDGKWRGLMSAAPRNLPVFEALRTTLAADTIAGCRYIAHNAADYTSASPEVQTVEMLGHSMQAVRIPKGARLTYDFETTESGQAVLYTAMIPTQPNVRGDLRYTVQIDDQQPVTISLKEKFRSEQWKRNVLRQQALKRTNVKLEAGRHRLTIAAVDDHIIADQWMIDFEPQRRFYVIPTTR